MAERVTRQFADVPTGEPVVGGLFRLVNKTDPTDLPHEMLETTDPLYPGRYYTADGDNLAPGIYAVERNTGSGYTPTGEEVSVNPHRVYAGDISVDNTSLTQVGLVLGDTVRASAFVPEGTDAGVGLLQYLQTAVNYAAGAGLTKVYVGSWRGRDRWEGVNQLNLTEIEHIELDLGGAEIARTGGLTPIAMAGGVIHSGRIEMTGTTNPVISVSNRNYHPVFRDIEFSGTNLVATTMSGGDWVRCRYKNCKGQILFTEPYCQPADPLIMGRTQESDTACYMVDGSLYMPVDECNTPSDDIGGFFGALRRTGTSDDPGRGSMPFSSGIEAGQALAHLYFGQMPRINEIRSKSILANRTVTVGSPTCQLIPWYADRESLAQVDAVHEGDSVDSVSPTLVIAGEVIEREFIPASDTKYRKVNVTRVMEFPADFTIGANTGKMWVPGIITVPIPSIGLDLNGSAYQLPARCLGRAKIVQKESNLTPGSGHDVVEIPAVVTFDGVNGKMIFNFGVVGKRGTESEDGFIWAQRPMLMQIEGSLDPTVIIVEAEIPNAGRTDIPRLL